MQRTFLVCLLACFMILGCKKPVAKATTPPATQNTNPENACPEYFFYYQEEKVALTMKPSFILVGFKKELSLEQKAALLRSFPEYENLTANQASDATPFNVVKLKKATTCARALEIMKQLQEKNEVTFANPVFNPVRQMGDEYDWLGLTASVLVTVKSADQLPQLKAEVTQTKTEISDVLGETTLQIQVTKNSKGNALEMANYFHDLPYVINSEPDFYLATKTRQTAPTKP
jgi:hypothetical protein